MNENLENAVTELINKSLQGIDSTQKFLTSEVPDVINQLLVWKFFESFIFCLLGMLILFGTIFFNWKQYKYWKGLTDEQIKKLRPEFTDYRDEKLDVGAILIFNILNFIPCLISALLINIKWLQIWVAPKVWLIEYMKKFVS